MWEYYVSIQSAAEKPKQSLIVATLNSYSANWDQIVPSAATLDSKQKKYDSESLLYDFRSLILESIISSEESFKFSVKIYQNSSVISSTFKRFICQVSTSSTKVLPWAYSKGFESVGYFTNNLDLFCFIFLAIRTQKNLKKVDPILQNSFYVSCLTLLEKYPLFDNFKHFSAYFVKDLAEIMKPDFFCIAQDFSDFNLILPEYKTLNISLSGAKNQWDSCLIYFTKLWHILEKTEFSYRSYISRVFIDKQFGQIVAKLIETSPLKSKEDTFIQFDNLFTIDLDLIEMLYHGGPDTVSYLMTALWVFSEKFTQPNPKTEDLFSSFDEEIFRSNHSLKLKLMNFFRVPKTLIPKRSLHSFQEHQNDPHPRIKYSKI